MPLFQVRDQTLYFAHVPRTGGSNLENYLAARFGSASMLDRDWMSAWAGGGWRRDSLLTSPQHMTAVDAARVLPVTGVPSFAVVRDPAARIVSEFRFQARRGFRRRRLTELGFSTWLRLMLAAAHRDPRIFDNHLRPQTEIVPQTAVVFRLEGGLDPVIAWIDAIAEETAPELVIGNDEPASFRGTVAPSRDDLRLIARFYASDYKRFGYLPPDLASAAPDRLAPARGALGAALAPAVAWMYLRGRI
jgi:hypothetical protein